MEDQDTRALSNSYSDVVRFNVTMAKEVFGLDIRPRQHLGPDKGHKFYMEDYPDYRCCECNIPMDWDYGAAPCFSDGEFPHIEYSSDNVYLRVLYNRIVELGLREQFIYWLISEITGNDGEELFTQNLIYYADPGYSYDLFDLVSSTREQQARAALRAVRSGKGERWRLYGVATD